MRAERTLVIEFRAARLTLLDDLNRLDPGAGEREKLLDAHTVAVTRNGEVTSNIAAAIVNRENLALEILNAELVAFLNLDRNANGISSAEIRIILVLERCDLLSVNLINKLDTHGLALLLLGLLAGLL